LNIEAPGVVTYDSTHSADLKRWTGGQLFGVDTMVVHKDKAFVTYSTTWISVPLWVITMIDLDDFEATRIGVDGSPMGLAVIPTPAEKGFFERTGVATCVGFCAGVNIEQNCFCDEDCLDWGDCCPDYEDLCTSCDEEACAIEGQVCVNRLDGTYGCGCPEWYVGYAGTCVDIDECFEGADNCTEDATCVNVEGGYYCDCDPGFESDGAGGCQCAWGSQDDGEGGCENVDECTLNIDSCQDDEADCVDVDAGYLCECEAPFVENGYGGCRCPDGYQDDGEGGCENIDECALGTDDCDDETEDCVDNDGGWDCVPN
jgi:hypothetical protein